MPYPRDAITQSGLKCFHSVAVMQSLFWKVSYPRFLNLSAQGIQHRLASGVSSLHNGDTQNQKTNSVVPQPFGEIAVKKSVRVTYAECGPPGEILKAIFANDGDRRLWISFSGDEPTDEDFAQVWPKSRQKRIVRQLEVSMDGCVDDKGHYESAEVYKVAEKKGAGERRFWREVRSFDWEEFMREEGFFEEIDRQMKKSF